VDRLEEYFSKQENQPIKTSSGLLREVAYERIKDAIQHAAFTPGQPLSETQLSKLLGISRTPIREAIQQLSQEGLLRVIPGRAVTIASRSVQDVLNAVHLRALLEPELARLVAMSVNPSQQEGLEQTLHDMEKAIREDNPAAWSKANTRYHQILSDACPNPLLGELVLQMCNRVHHLANIDSQTNPSRLAACTEEHKRIVTAIVTRDAEAAERAMRDHIHELRESLFNRFNRLNSV
jgi:DNA-binding GntR family transcriptional regulator